MPVQDGSLVMVGLGTQGDAPPNNLQPTLLDGVHLRWAFQRVLGFPWYGFYLYRRQHQRGEPQCLSMTLRERQVGVLSSSQYSTPTGSIESDRSLVLTDDFPRAGLIEFDLAARRYLAFHTPPTEVARWVDVKVGFRKEEPLPDDERCIDFRERSPGRLRNRTAIDKVRIEALDDNGRFVSNLRLARVAGAVGLAITPTTSIEFDEGAVAVELRMGLIESQGIVQAFDEIGELVDEAKLDGDGAPEQRILLRSACPIKRLVFHEPVGRAFLFELCLRGGNHAGITVAALRGGVTLASQTLPFQPGQIVNAMFEEDAIDEIRLGPGAAALIDVCWIPVSQGASRGWEVMRDFVYPMGLPVTHPTYPATGSAPVNLNNARNRATGRIRYGVSTPWAASFPSMHTELLNLVTGGPGSTPMVDRVNPRVTAVPSPPDPGLTPPTMPNQRPLDMVLLAALNAAVSEMLGLAWLDRHAPPGVPFDYLIIADYTGVGGLDGNRMRSHIEQAGFAAVNGYIVFNKMTAPATPLAPPSQPRAYALPGSTRRTQIGDIRDGTNNAGLRWNLQTLAAAVTPLGGRFLLPLSAVMYHIWLADMGNGVTPAASGAVYKETSKNPTLVGEPKLPPGVAPQRPLDWPPFPMHYQQTGLGDGWWSLQLSGIDVFGRHSANSAAAPWYKWAPAPDPRPWYYVDPVADASIHPFAVRLLDKVPPPFPTSIEAYALDPADPTVLRDTAYNTWQASLNAAERDTLIGLRVSWQWTAAHMRQAPDTKEFRIYFHPGRINTLAGRITAAVPAGSRETAVTTDSANSAAAGSFVGTTLRIGADSYPVIASEAVSPLRVRVRNVGATVDTGTVSVASASPVVAGTGTSWHAGLTNLSFQITGDASVYRVLSVESATQLTLDRLYAGPTAAGASYALFSKRPPVGVSCAIAIAAVVNDGNVTVANGSATVIGAGTNWQAPLAGQVLRVEGYLVPYRIMAVVSPAQLTLDRPYAGPSGAAKVYTISHPLFEDFSVTTRWDERYYVVGYNEHVTPTTDATGLPLRNYEVIIPAPADAFRASLPLVTSTAEPLVYAHVGVSAADDKLHTPDDPKWAAGLFGGRTGNEGLVGPPATVFRVHRVPPPPPAVPPDSERVFATPADYHSLSYYTYRWRPLPNTRAHVFRALDDAVFAADFALRPRPALGGNQTASFPDAAVEPRWNLTKRNQVAAELNQLNGFAHDTAGKAQAMTFYRGLSNDGLRVLAGLPGTGAAFTQLTIHALDPGDPANANRLGPDNPSGFIVDPALRAYVDPLDGRSTNRYFYRAAYVDGAHNRGPLGLSGPPVWLQNVVAPWAPVLTKALGGDRQVTLSWASNREPDLAEYRVYRTDAEDRGRDIRLMTLVHTEAVPAGDPATRPAEVSWTDKPVPGLRNLYYRLVAVDDAANASNPSAAAVGRATDTTLPVVPALTVTWVADAPPVRASVDWVSVDETRLERRALDSAVWDALGDWRTAGTYSETVALDSSASWRFRLRVRKYTGATATGTPVPLNHV